ncbi:hypothetical protein RCL1_002388 [Eukaryota sp. TZLM3-RCL]
MPSSSSKRSSSSDRSKERKSSKSSSSKSDDRSSSSKRSSSSSSRKDKEKSSRSSSNEIPPDSTVQPLSTTPPITNPVCSNCSKQPSSNFCLHCSSFLCQSCDLVMHSSSFSFHTRMSALEAAQMSRKCPFHPSELLSYYCSSCKRCICNVCADSCKSQPLHTVKPVGETFTELVRLLEDKVESQLKRRREEILKSYNKVEEIERKIQERGVEIDRETRDLAQSISSRLAGKLEVELALPRQMKKQLYGFLEIIERFKISKEAQNHSKMIDFISNHESTLSELDHVIHANLPEFEFDLDNSLENLPREAILLKNKVEEGLESSVDQRIQSEMIEYLLSQTPSLPTNNVENFDEFSSELSKWVTLTDKYAKELAKFVMKCKYCDTLLSPEVINSSCRLEVTGRRIEIPHHWIRIDDVE